MEPPNNSSTVRMSNKSKLHNDVEHELHGNGEKKLIFIPGLMCDRALWKYQIEHILNNEQNCEILTVNNYGTVRDHKVNISRSYFDRFKISMYADDIKNLIDLYGWTKVTIIGISMGGMIALRFAVKYPQNTLSMILINTHSGGFSGFPKIVGIIGIIKHVIFPGKTTYFDTIYGNTKKTIADRIIQDITENYDISHLTKHNINKIITSFFQIIAIFAHYITQNEFDLINDAQIPSLIVTGMNDNIIDPNASLEMYQKLKNSELFILKESGHFLVLDDHDKVEGAGHVFNEKLSEFLQKIYDREKFNSIKESVRKMTLLFIEELKKNKENNPDALF